MTWTAILDILADIGGATVHSVWIPLLAWTILVIPIWSIVRRTDRLHPLVEYRLSQALLASLPLGILAAAATDLFAVAPPTSPLVELGPPSSVLHNLSFAEAGVSTEMDVAPTAATWHWTHAVGTATVIALGLTAVRLGQLALQFAAALGVRATVDSRNSDEVVEEANRLARQQGIVRHFRVRVSSDAAVPLTIVGLPPTVVVPDHLGNDPNALRMALHHELVHVRRRDDLAHLVERIITATFAAIPPVQWLQRSIARCREQACDAAVLEQETTRLSAYARLLVGLADRTDCSPAMLSLSTSPSPLKQRLRAMENYVASSPTRWTSGIAIAALVAVTLGILACSDSVGPSAPLSDTPPVHAPSAGSAGENMIVTGEMAPSDLKFPPVLVGGMDALREDITYPVEAQEAGIEGRVIVQFVVDEAGNVQDAKVARGAHELLNEMAIQATEQQEFEPSLPSTPVRMVVPIAFRLAESSSTSESEVSQTSPSVKLQPRRFGGMVGVPIRIRSNGTVLVNDSETSPSNLHQAVRRHLRHFVGEKSLKVEVESGAPSERVDHVYRVTHDRELREIAPRAHYESVQPEG